MNIDEEPGLQKNEKNKKIKIVVVIPARNEEQNIVNTLQYLLNQDLLPYRIVVVNDGSTDKTKKIENEKKCKLIEIFNQTHNNTLQILSTCDNTLNKTERKFVSILWLTMELVDNSTIDHIYSYFPPFNRESMSFFNFSSSFNFGSSVIFFLSIISSNISFNILKMILL